MRTRALLAFLAARANSGLLGSGLRDGTWQLFEKPHEGAAGASEPREAVADHNDSRYLVLARTEYGAH